MIREMKRERGEVNVKQNTLAAQGSGRRGGEIRTYAPNTSIFFQLENNFCVPTLLYQSILASVFELNSKQLKYTRVSANKFLRVI